jgi:putative hemolysin
MDGTSILYLVLFVICIAASAFFSSAETAFVSLSKTRVIHLVEVGVHGAKRVERITERPEKFLATVLLGNNLVNVAAASLGTALAVRVWKGDIGILIATIVVTIILLIFAEVTPKTFALRHAERMTLIYIYPIDFINRILAPLATLLSWIGTTLAGSKGGLPQTLVSEEEIRSMISVGRKEGTFEVAEAEMLHNVFDFGDRHVREVMTPRPQVVGVQDGTTLADFLSIYAKSPYTRFPVYRDNIDNVVGILSIKDMLMAQAMGTLDKNGVIDELVRPVIFVPETKRIAQLFAEMQSEGYQMVIVIDEYGVTSGIITKEQLVSEIVGEMGDEMRKDDKDFEVIDEKTIQVDGSMRIDEANEELGLDLPTGDYDTVAGFILHLLGRIPREGERVRYGGMKLAITQMNKLRIETIIIVKE